MRWSISRILYLQSCASNAGHDHLTGIPVTRYLLQPTRKLRRAALKRLPIWSCTRWGLPCPLRHRKGGELLPRHFNLTCGCRHPIGGIFSAALSSGYPKFPLRTTVPCGVRTFLSGTNPERSCLHLIFQIEFLLNQIPVFPIYAHVSQFIGPFILFPRYMGDTPVRNTSQQHFNLFKQRL